MYTTYEKLNWNNGRSFPLESIFQKNDRYRKFYRYFLQNLKLISNVKNGFNFLNEVWDYAILLDACRYDVFEEINTFDGNLQKKQSIASHTSEWIKKGIKRKYCDTIIITANPKLSKYKLKEYTGESNRFYKNVPAWDLGWDDELKTVPPWHMLEIAIKRIQRNKNKKIIFWFMQPHHPFLIDTKKTYMNPKENNNFKIKNEDVWKALRSGEISIVETLKAYKNNLKIVIKYVDKLIDYLGGKIVITSDHGNCFGELGLFSHPPKIHIPPLIDIPYLEINK